MHRKQICAILLFGLMAVSLLSWMGIGPYASSSAVSDLKAELEGIYGPEYTGTESMEFVIKPKTWILTNWNLRNALGLDYQYECRVIFTTQTAETTKITKTITYQAVDPMGAENMNVRAHLDIESMSVK